MAFLERGLVASVVILRFAEKQPQIPIRLRSWQAFDSESRKERGFLRSWWTSGLGFVGSHPFARRKANGWGTGAGCERRWSGKVPSLDATRRGESGCSGWQFICF